MNISFVGAGNVAWHLAQAFEDAGHLITEVYSRDPQNARQLTNELYDTVIQPDLNLADSKAELVVLAVSDDALEEVIQRIVLPENAIVVHTSGTQSLSNLQQWIEANSDVPVHTGVLYPLQTFSKAVDPDYSKIPFCLEADNDQTLDKLIELAKSVSDNVNQVDSYERRVLHIAAVFACNFTNHLLSITHDLLKAEDLDFDLFKPLITETINKALASTNPALGQTGPARRGDWATTAVHLEYLQANNPEWASIYRLLTDSIRQRHFSEL